MTEALLQSYIPSVATMILVGVGILFNNARIGDLNTVINKRIDDLRADTMGRFADMAARFERLESQHLRLESQYSRLESVVVGKLEELDARLSRILSHLNLH